MVLNTIVQARVAVTAANGPRRTPAKSARSGAVVGQVLAALEGRRRPSSEARDVLKEPLRRAEAHCSI